MDTCSLLSLYQCCLEDAVFTGQMANFSALTSFLQCFCVCVMSCPWSQILMAVIASQQQLPSCPQSIFQGLLGPLVQEGAPVQPPRAPSFSSWAPREA